MRVNLEQIYIGLGKHGESLSWEEAVMVAVSAKHSTSTPSGSHPCLMDEPGVVASLIPSYRTPQGGPLRFTPNSGESRRASFPNH